MGDEQLAGPCTDNVGIAFFVGALWQLGGGALDVNPQMHPIKNIQKTRQVLAGVTKPPTYYHYYYLIHLFQ